MSRVPGNVKNLIFDFGGVIINIDFENAFNAFVSAGVPHVKEVWKKALSTGLLYEFEKGKLTPAAFRNEMNVLSGVYLTTEEFDRAWNAMLLDIPEERVRLIEKLKKNYRVFLLSNTNQIHYDDYSGMLAGYGYKKLDDLFHGAWFSFRMEKLKPDRAIYNEVVEKEGLVPTETLFVDDLQVNVDGAVSAGLKGLCIAPGTLSGHFSD